MKDSVVPCYLQGIESQGMLEYADSTEPYNTMFNLCHA